MKFDPADTILETERNLRDSCRNLSELYRRQYIMILREFSDSFDARVKAMMDDIFKDFDTNSGNEINTHGDGICIPAPAGYMSNETSDSDNLTTMECLEQSKHWLEQGLYLSERIASRTNDPADIMEQADYYKDLGCRILNDCIVMPVFQGKSSSNGLSKAEAYLMKAIEIEKSLLTEHGTEKLEEDIICNYLDLGRAAWETDDKSQAEYVYKTCLECLDHFTCMNEDSREKWRELIYKAIAS